MKYAIVGAGIAGLSAARILMDKGHDVKIFESKSIPGGLISCDRVNGNLYHRVGGHVFNSKHKDVLDWFFSRFNKNTEFVKAKRNAKILLDNKFIGYPIENHLYQLPDKLLESVIDDLSELIKKNKDIIYHQNFEDFLKNNFGSTLFQIYFEPYNTKIWNCDLKNVAIEWLQGKLPMPNYKEMLIKSIKREEEENMVHSKFFYPKNGGSQFIANRLAENINIEYNFNVNNFELNNNKWYINNTQNDFDFIIYTSDVRCLKNKLPFNIAEAIKELSDVEGFLSHGTSNALCEVGNPNDFSWVYIPDRNIRSHRIINTGNFSASNNNAKVISCTVEFTGELSKKEMDNEIKKLPGNLNPIAYNYEKNTYVIQDHNTNDIIKKLKKKLNTYL